MLVKAGEAGDTLTHMCGHNTCLHTIYNFVALQGNEQFLQIRDFTLMSYVLYKTRR